MAMLSIIRRWHLREHVSLRKIAERLNISRNTVRRYLRNQDLVPQHAKRKTPSKLDTLLSEHQDTGLSSCLLMLATRPVAHIVIGRTVVLDLSLRRKLDRL